MSVFLWLSLTDLICCKEKTISAAAVLCVYTCWWLLSRACHDNGTNPLNNCCTEIFWSLRIGIRFIIKKLISIKSVLYRMPSNTIWHVYLLNMMKRKQFMPVEMSSTFISTIFHWKGDLGMKYDVHMLKLQTSLWVKRPWNLGSLLTYG